MARVFDAFDEQLERPVAIKVLRAETQAIAGMRQRFQQEALIAARLIHPNIVAVLDFGEEEATSYLVMERLPGNTLRDEIVARGPLPPEQGGAGDRRDTIGTFRRTPVRRPAPRRQAQQHPAPGGRAHQDHRLRHRQELRHPERPRVDDRRQDGDRIRPRHAGLSGTGTPLGLPGDGPIRSLCSWRGHGRGIDRAAPRSWPVPFAQLAPPLRDVARRAMAADPHDRFTSAAEMSQALQSGTEPRARRRGHGHALAASNRRGPQPCRPEPVPRRSAPPPRLHPPRPQVRPADPRPASAPALGGGAASLPPSRSLPCSQLPVRPFFSSKQEANRREPRSRQPDTTGRHHTHRPCTRPHDPAGVRRGEHRQSGRSPSHSPRAACPGTARWPQPWRRLRCKRRVQRADLRRRPGADTRPGAARRRWDLSPPVPSSGQHPAADRRHGDHNDDCTSCPGAHVPWAALRLTTAERGAATGPRGRPAASTGVGGGGGATLPRRSQHRDESRCALAARARRSDKRRQDDDGVAQTSTRTRCVRRYRAERDKRLRTDGNAQYVEVAGSFADYLLDPYTEPVDRAARRRRRHGPRHRRWLRGTDHRRSVGTGRHRRLSHH